MELVAAVESLYQDGLRPYGRILRKRLLELSEALGYGPLDMDLKDLKVACSACATISVEEANPATDWAALLPGRETEFVDIYSSVDDYPRSMWEQAEQYFANLPAGWTLPGGRFACSQVLMRMKLPFLEGYSLGQVCHIVQLAISQRKLLGYTNGMLLPYFRSESWRKDQSALNKHPCSAKSRGRHAIATWDTLRRSIARLWLGSRAKQPRIPLSNIKHVLRTRCQLELSETALGYAKLSDLFQDPRMAGVCAASQSTYGYMIVPPTPPEDAHNGDDDDDLGDDGRDKASEASPRSGSTGAGSSSPESQEADLAVAGLPSAPHSFRRGAPAEPLSMEVIFDEKAAGMLSPSMWPGDSNGAQHRGHAVPTPRLLSSARRSPQNATSAAWVPPSAAETLVSHEVIIVDNEEDCEVVIVDEEEDFEASTDSMPFCKVPSVRRTFIHMALPPPTPIAGATGARARASSSPPGA